jgi:hypothetical protein
MTGALVLAGNPTSALQAATKQYVDAIAPAVSVTTAAGGITAAVSNNAIIVVDKTTPATTAVTLPASSNFSNCPTVVNSCPVYQIKDGAGNSATYPITITPADGKTIDGSSSLIIQSNYQAVTLVLNGTQWNVL